MSDTQALDTFEILLVEDSAMDALLVKRALATNKTEGNLAVVTDGEQAMSYLRLNATGPKRPNLILLDLSLPKLDGWDVLKACKLDPALKTIPIVVFTTTNSTEEIQICYELGADSVVVKPPDLEPFLKTIRSIDDYWRRVSYKKEG